MNDSAKAPHQNAPTAETAEAPAPTVLLPMETLFDDEPRPAAPTIKDRIEEYQHAALQEKSPLRAILGAYNAELMAIGSRVQQAVLAHLETGPADVKQIAPVLRLIDTDLKIARQIDRFAQLELQERAAARKIQKQRERTG